MLVRIWQYDVAAGAEADFEREYGSGGAWVRLFGSSAGYLGTELFRCLDVPGWYLTVDRFADDAAWRRFLALRRDEYEALDVRCAELTTAEVELAG